NMATVWAVIGDKSYLFVWPTFWEIEDDDMKAGGGEKGKFIRILIINGVNHFMHWDEPEKTMGVFRRLLDKQIEFHSSGLLGLSEQAGRHWQNIKRDYPNHKEDFTKCKGTFKDFWPTQTGRVVASFINSHLNVDFTDLDKLDRSLKTKDEPLYEVTEEAFEQSSGAFTPSSQPRSLSLLAARFEEVAALKQFPIHQDV
ncbi:hypothetical protein F5877DRAFT_73357, partial [Lentinula edodes]